LADRGLPGSRALAAVPFGGVSDQNGSHAAEDGLRRRQPDDGLLAANQGSSSGSRARPGQCGLAESDRESEGKSQPDRSSPTPHVTHAVAPGSTFWSVDAPAWITAIATVGLLAGAVVTAIFAVKAFRKQAREVDLLQRQAERDVDERRRAQARLVFIYLVDHPAEHDLAAAADQMDAAIRAKDASVTVLAARLSNTSKQPVYDLVVQWSIGGNVFGDLQEEPQLMPGEERETQQTWPVSGGISIVAVTFHFSDAAGVRWRTTDRGGLAEVCGARPTHPERPTAALRPVTLKIISGHPGERSASARSELAGWAGYGYCRFCRCDVAITGSTCRSGTVPISGGRSARQVLYRRLGDVLLAAAVGSHAGSAATWRCGS
jgi:type II secretory pathway pseudopilin PulG